MLHSNAQDVFFILWFVNFKMRLWRMHSIGLIELSTNDDKFL